MLTSRITEGENRKF